MTETPWEVAITADRVRVLLEQTVAKEKSLRGGEKLGCVDGSLGNAWAGEQYLEQDGAVRPGLAFGCFLLLYLARNHCFADGNKRVAWMAFSEVMLGLGLEIEATADEVVTFVEEIAKGNAGSIPLGAYRHRLGV